VLVGLPFTEPAMNSTRSGGSPYGASHVAGAAAAPATLSSDEQSLARALGARVAALALQLRR
jgi:NAD(P)H dehydrogenase (quinone)